jgi:hypothetical protein
MDLSEVEEVKKLQEQSKRRDYLLQILETLLSGEFNSELKPRADIFNQNINPRHEYVSSKDRSSNNYGYMELFESAD